MVEAHNTLYTYAVAGVLFTFLLPITFYLRRLGASNYSLSWAATGSLLWATLVAFADSLLSLHGASLLLVEVLRYAFWTIALLGALSHVANTKLPKGFSIFFHGLWLIGLILAVGLVLSKHPAANNNQLLIWSSLILAISLFIVVEQLYKNTSEFRLLKLWSLVAGATFGYDIYLFAHSLVFNEMSLSLWQARGAINGAAALILIIGSMVLSRQASDRARLTLSRPVAFYTTSITAAGTFLALISLGGYYVQLYGGSWGSIFQILALFLAMLAIATIFVSKTIRSRLNVWINKYFFRHKYDYRTEWLQLINYLSQTPDAQDFYERAITAVASTFKSESGALWMHQGDSYRPVASLNFKLPKEALKEPDDSKFCRVMLEQEWIFSPYSLRAADKENNLTIPNWLYRLPKIWLVQPLIVEEELLGFIMLTEPQTNSQLTWEDIDLLKTVGRQVASYIVRHNAAEVIAESRQFDAFNKLTAFIMHDLKNLIAQQALVVENAAKHKENPAFVEDAIHTIENSVTRMSTLLRKLQQNEPAELRSLELHKVLMDATKRCQRLKPSPSLRLEDTDIIINADPDHLAMMLEHLIKNAQEATPSTGFVDVTLRRENSNAIITIEDNGEGMDADFIRNQLFKPFVTTKSGKGMGIGVYQAREFLESLGGQLTVESEPGVGTTFTAMLPANTT